MDKDGDDGVLFAGVSGSGAHAIFATRKGQVLRTELDKVNPQASGSARGVAGIGLNKGDEILAGCIVHQEEMETNQIFLATETGMVKRVPLAEYPLKGRGTKGVKSLNITPKTGQLAGLCCGHPDRGLDIIFENGRRQHIPPADIPITNRYNLGQIRISIIEAEAKIEGIVAIA